MTYAIYRYNHGLQSLASWVTDGWLEYEIVQWYPGSQSQKEMYPNLIQHTIYNNIYLIYNNDLK